MRNIMCLTSSQSVIFHKIKMKGIKIEVAKIVPKKIFFLLFVKICFSVKGNRQIPISIKKGNLTESNIGIYVGGKSFAYMQVPKVSVHTLL